MFKSIKRFFKYTFTDEFNRENELLRIKLDRIKELTQKLDVNQSPDEYRRISDELVILHNEYSFMLEEFVQKWGK